MRYFKLFAALALLALVLSFAPGVARAEGPDGGAKVVPNLGPVVPGLTPGMNGYKVFGPDAIKRVPIQPIRSSSMSPIAPTLYRAGWSDAYKNDCGQWYWCIGGSHVSQSDLSEQEIWVDGALKTNWDSTWRTSCPNHTSGQIAQCTTNWDPHGGWLSATAHSWHHFHTTGFGDQNFQTEDTVQG